MSDKVKKSVQKAEASGEAFAKERGAFKSLLLTNPNHFGNLVDSVFKPVISISGNTFYEELGCVGYHPQQRRLEAVVYQNQPGGYGTDECGPGTPEFVRFYLSFDHGASWVDQGMTSFQAYDIPEGTEGAKRLEYAVSLAPHLPLRFCLGDLLIRVRAILSWNNPPPPNQPNWAPIWGNRREATILIEPLRLFPPKDLFDLAKIKLPAAIKDLIDLDTPIPAKAKVLGAVELASIYAGKDIPVHRFAFKELSAFAASTTALSAESFLSQLPGIHLDPSIVAKLFPTDGDTSFEELKCIGLDPNTPDTLVGIIQVKKDSGYSGGPCTRGSKEYVTFWGDFDNNGSFETCLGTADVTVYDVSGTAPQDVFYSVRLPVDLTQYRQDCHKPRVVPIRAILSWNVPVPCANPSKVPTWGNREETLINIAPIAQTPAGKIAILGGIPVSMIDGAGLTTPTAVFATNNQAPDALGRPCPFAARVAVQGSPVTGYTYQVEVSPDNTTYTPVLTDLTVVDQIGNTSTHKANPVTKRFDYLPFTSNVNSLLAEWDSTGDALWYVRLSVYDGGGIFQGSDTHVVQLDNTGPEASIDITTGLGNCGKFMPGEALGGSFVARDTYLGSYSLGVEPVLIENVPPIGVPIPSGGLVNTSPLPGDPWTLDTTNMKPCGYVIRVVAVDRAIVNSQSVGHQASDSAGFCLEPREQS